MRKLGPALAGIVFAAMVAIALLSYPLSSTAAPADKSIKALAMRERISYAISHRLSLF